MLEETALNDNTEKRLYDLSARCPCLSTHYSRLSSNYLFIPALCPCLSPHTLVLSTHYSLSFPYITNSFQHICSAFHHTTSSFPRGPSIPHIPPSLSPHNLLLSARFILLSTAVIDVARLIQPLVLPFPEEKAVS